MTDGFRNILVRTTGAIALVLSTPVLAQDEDNASIEAAEEPAAQPEVSSSGEAEADFGEATFDESADSIAVPVAPVMVSPPAAVAYAYSPTPPPPPVCEPEPKPCVRIAGLPGLSFYVVNEDRFRYWATNGHRASYSADRGIQRLLSADLDRLTIPSEGHLATQLRRVGRPYLVIPWCARDADGHEVWKASWRTKQEVVMREDAVQLRQIQCQ
jgi:hypothetical protein